MHFVGVLRRLDDLRGIAPRRPVAQVPRRLGERRRVVGGLRVSVLLVQALQHGSFADVREALRDRWHQPFRAAMVPGFTELLALEHPDLLGVCLSGSGPSVLALCVDAEESVSAAISAVYDRLGVPCVVRRLEAHQPGILA